MNNTHVASPPLTPPIALLNGVQDRDQCPLCVIAGNGLLCRWHKCLLSLRLHVFLVRTGQERFTWRMNQ